MIHRIIQTDLSKATILIRLMVGAVFLSEGVQKFLFPTEDGVGRFEAIGFPNPAFYASFVGSFEIICGILLIFGLITRVASLAMFINITVAIIVTKIPLGLGHGFGPFVVHPMKSYGFWSMAHEMRTDFSMWLGTLFLMIKGGGKWSLDYWVQKNYYSNNQKK